MRVCPTCKQPITTGPKLVCARCLERIKKGQRWHHEAGRVCHNDCDAAQTQKSGNVPRDTPLLDGAAEKGEEVSDVAM